LATKYRAGSPALARFCARAQDEIVLIERHPEEYAALARWSGRLKGIALHERDGREASLALTPPDIRRGLVIIDPSYEEKEDYVQSAKLAADVCARWPQAIVLPVEQPSRSDRIGMLGSGMAVLNPPWQYAEQVHSAEQWLIDTLQ